MTVYFLQRNKDPDGLIKIGTSTDLETRFANIGTYTPDGFVVLGTLQGGGETEGFIHDQLASSRHSKEWFRPTREVFEVIERSKRIGHGSMPFADPDRKGNPKSSKAAKSACEDANIAAELLIEAMGPILGRDTKGAAMERLYRKLHRHNNEWTRRRVRAIFDMEAARIDYWVIRNLTTIIRANREDEKREAERLSHLNSIINADAG